MSIRVERVAKKIKFLIATALQRELSDPRMGFVTVVRCDLSADYRHCRVHVSVLGDDAEVSRVMHMLEDARGFIQRYVATNLDTRATPHLEFERDRGAERSVEMSALLNDLKREREEREGEDEAEAEGAEGSKSDDGDDDDDDDDGDDGDGDDGDGGDDEA